MKGNYCKEINDFPTFLSLKENWNSLAQKSSINSIFLRHEWIRCWWEAYGKDKELLIMLFYEGDDLKGIGPLMISKGFFRGLPVKTISFIENDETPHCGLLLDRSYELSDIVPALFSHLTSRGRGKWDILHLRKVQEGNGFSKYSRRFFERTGYNIIIRPSLRSPILKIKSDWKSFYSGKSQRFKKKIRYDLNKLKRKGNVKIQCFDTPEQIERVMEGVFCVGRRSWKGKIGESIGSTQQTRSFYFTLPRALADAGNCVVVWTLSLDGKMISFEYHIRQNNTVYALRGAYDKEYQDVGPGAVLDYEVVRGLFENDVHCYNMCGDPYQYKLRWTPTSQLHKDVIIFRSGLYGKILAFLETDIRPIAESLLNLTRIRFFHSK